MSAAVLLPGVTSVLAFVFAAALFDQWRDRRHAFQLVWAIGVLFYGIAPIVYLIAALILAVAVAVATYFQDERWPLLAAVAVVGATLLSIGIMVTTTLPAPGYALDPATGTPSPDLLPGSLRLLTPFLNFTGGLALLLGALFSTYLFMPKRR